MNHARFWVMLCAVILMAHCGSASAHVNQTASQTTSSPPLRANDAGGAAHHELIYPGQKWSGYYVCAQGLTDLTLTITKVDGATVGATFRFYYALGDIAGSYTLAGRYQPEFARLTFKPDDWIEQPPGYIMVGLRGNISGDGREYSGFVMERSCAMFELRKSN